MSGQGAVRLRPGALFYPGGDGRWRVALEDDEFLIVEGRGEIFAAARPYLHGFGDDARPTEAVRQMLDRFADEGLVYSAAPAPRGAVLLDCGGQETAENPLGAEVRRQCAAVGIEVVRWAGSAAENGLSGAGADAESRVLVSCAGWLPDARWARLDRWCAERGVPWHRVHLEGGRVVLGPFTSCGPSELRYRDVRGRRLAAADAPEELLTLWRYLDTGDEVPAPPWPSAPALAVAAAMIVADVGAVLRGEPAPTAGHQVVLDAASLDHVWHRVLPLPGRAHQGSVDSPSISGRSRPGVRVEATPCEDGLSDTVAAVGG